jgi:rubrerythrin
MKTRMLMIFVVALSLALAGCENKSGDAAKADEAKAEEPAEGEDEKAEESGESDEAEESGDDEAAEKQEPAEKVEVAEGGTEFDPAIQPEKLPDGAWYCDMGTVHWAGTEKPEDGKCPVCGMKVKQYDPEKHAEKEKGAVEAKDDHGHEHEGGDHDHAH